MYTVLHILTNITVKYSPVICDHICTSVIAVGLLGVWRTTQLDYVSNDECAVREMSSEKHQFRPDLHNFCVTEISSGKLHWYQLVGTK